MAFFDVVNGLRALVAKGTETYELASNIALAATTGGTPVASVAGGSYVFTPIFTGTSVKLQALGPNGSTYVDVATVATSGTPTGVVIGNNATVRLYNPNGSGLTGVYASLT